MWWASATLKRNVVSKCKVHFEKKCGARASVWGGRNLAKKCRFLYTKNWNFVKILEKHEITTFLIMFALAHHISFLGSTCSPHFFLRLHLLTTFLFTVALAHHISFYFDKTCSTQIYNGCTCSPQFLFILRKQNTSKVANLFIKRIRHIIFTVLKQKRVKVARLREN